MTSWSQGLEEDFKHEIREIKNNVDSDLKTADDLMQEGIDEKRKEAPKPTEKQILISFLTKSMEEKEKVIRAKESDLECPVCLETARGEILCCIHQHLVCSQCRPRVVECPQCRQPYPPTPIRHRYAEKIAAELERLRQNLNGIQRESGE